MPHQGAGYQQQQAADEQHAGGGITFNDIAGYAHNDRAPIRSSNNVNMLKSWNPKGINNRLKNVPNKQPSFSDGNQDFAAPGQREWCCG